MDKKFALFMNDIDNIYFIIMFSMLIFDIMIQNK